MGIEDVLLQQLLTVASQTAVDLQVGDVECGEALNYLVSGLKRLASTVEGAMVLVQNSNHIAEALIDLGPVVGGRIATHVAEHAEAPLSATVFRDVSNMMNITETV